jgi:hypothetical protein
VSAAVFPVDGSKVYGEAPSRELHLWPSVLPWTVMVWVRVAQAVAG